MAADMTLSETVMGLQPVATLNSTLARLTFLWQRLETTYLIGICGMPLFEVDTEEKACWLCEHLNDGLWGAVDKIIDINNKAMRDVLGVGNVSFEQIV